MLKLIYSLSDKEITLKFNKKRLFWSKELWTAFLISFGIHLIAFALFRITSLKPFHEVVLKPGAVISEIKKIALAEKKILIDEYGFIQKVPLPPKSFVSYSNISGSLGNPFTLEDEKMIKKNESLFDLIESKKELIAPPISLYKVIQPIKIDVSGSLKSRCLGLRIKPKKILLGTTETLYIKFGIRVEDRTGKIFHSELITSSGSSKYDRYGQSLLKNIQFEKIKTGFTTNGEIDFLIEADSRDIYD